MSSIAVTASASGAGVITLQAPITATNRTITLPDATGTVVSTGSISVVTPTMLTQPLTSGAVIASTSGTSIDFTGIPNWAKRITVMVQGVSTTGASPMLIQVGAGSITISGYLGSSGDIVGATASAITTGFGTQTAGNTNHVRHGFISIINITGNSWVAGGALALSTTGQVFITGGSVGLSATLDRVRITTVNGTDTFDAGSINILYEG